MRRFLIWSVLAAVVGLGLAAGGYWAYWRAYVRFQPVTVQTHAREIQRLLDQSSWISDGSGGVVLYVVGYRDSLATQRYLAQEAGKLRAAGVEVRTVLVARPAGGAATSTPQERATIAELWLTRDPDLYRRWMTTPLTDWTAAGIAPADGDLARAGVVEASRAFARRLGDLLAENGVGRDWPLIVWRDREGFLKACACTDPRAWVFIRDDLDAPDRLGGADADTVVWPEPPVPQAPPQVLDAPAATPPPAPLPTPVIPPITRTDPAATRNDTATPSSATTGETRGRPAGAASSRSTQNPTQSGAQGRTAPAPRAAPAARPSPARPPARRDEARPSRGEDTLFF